MPPTFYYTVLDENLRPYRLYRHTLGESIANDALIYEEQDSQFFVGCDKSRDDRYIFLTTGGKITSEQYFVSAIVYRRDSKRDGTQPLYLYGYGSYGASLDPGFSTNRLSLLDRGFVYAIAHIRGGSELGRHWYESGKFLQKKNTFLDFVACAEHLIAQKYTSVGKIAIAQNR